MQVGSGEAGRLWCASLENGFLVIAMALKGTKLQNPVVVISLEDNQIINNLTQAL